jgi:superkiller protein 3
VTGKTEKALSVFADCIGDHPDYSPLFVARGLCKQISRGDFSAPPEEDFQQAIKIDPSNSSAHNQLGLVYQDRGDLVSAETEFRLALAYKPDFFVALNNLAAVLIRQGKYDEAIRLLQKAISLQPDLRGLYIYTNLGLAFLQSGRTRRAEAAFLMETAINPQHLPAHVYLGNLYALSGRYEEAVQEYQRVLLTDPRNREALINQGAAFVMAGRNNLAIERLEKAVRLYPESPLAHYHLAKAYQGAGQKELSEKEMQKARELGYGQ